MNASEISIRSNHSKRRRRTLMVITMIITSYATSAKTHLYRLIDLFKYVSISARDAIQSAHIMVILLSIQPIGLLVLCVSLCVR